MGLANIYATEEFEPVLGILMSNKFEVFSTGAWLFPNSKKLACSMHLVTRSCLCRSYQALCRSFQGYLAHEPQVSHSYIAPYLLMDIYLTSLYSCCPNVVRYWCMASRSMYVYAARSIPKGSQVVTEYCDPFLPLRERRALLLNTYKIACTCPACTNSESDANRVRIQNIRDNLAPVIQWALTPTLPDDLLLVPSLEQLKLIEDEGLEGTEYYPRVLRRLWYIYFVLDDFGASGFYGRMLRAWKIANGTKRSDVIKETQSELELIQYAVNRRRLFVPRKAKLLVPVS